MIKIIVKDDYVVYVGGTGPSYSLDNGTIKALYKKTMGQDVGYLVDDKTGISLGILKEVDSRLANIELNNLSVPRDVVIDMYKAMQEGDKL